MLNEPELISFQDKYKRDLKLIAQQMKPRLADLIDDEPDEVNARKFYFNHVGIVTPRKKTTFNGPTPVMSPQHSRRMGALETFEWGDVFDEDQLRTLVENPESKHKKAAVAGFNRAIDLTIINAALGNSVVVAADESETPTALPAAQQIAVNFGGSNVNLTVAKLRRAKRNFDRAEVDEGVPNPKRVIVCTADEIEHMLGVTEITSADYNTVKALAEGKVDSFMGFEFRRVESVPLDSSGHRQVVALAKGGIGGHIDMEPMVDMGKDPGASFAFRVYMRQKRGATRVEDVRVQEIKCLVPS